MEIESEICGVLHAPTRNPGFDDATWGGVLERESRRRGIAHPIQETPTHTAAKKLRMTSEAQSTLPDNMQKHTDGVLGFLPGARA